MLRLFTIKIFLVFFISQLSIAQEANVFLSDGSIIEGSINLSTLREEGILIITGDNKERLKPEQVKSILFEDGLVISVKSITQFRNDYSEFEEEYFTEKIVEGTVSLWQAYGAEFDFSLEKNGDFVALQVIEIHTPTGRQRSSTYQEVLYRFFSDCRDEINTTSVSNSKSQLIDVVNKYNSCINSFYIPQSEYLIKTRIMEIGLDLGYFNGDLNFSGTTTSLGPTETDFSFDYNRSSISFIGLSVKSNIYKKNLFGGVGIQVNSYDFKPKLSDEVERGTRIEFSELVFKGFIEGRYQYKKFQPAIRIGVNLHSITKDIDGSLSVNALRNSVPIRFTPVSLKREGELNPSYSTLSLSPSVYYELSKSINIGLSYSFYNKVDGFLSNIDESSDKISRSSISFHLNLMIESLR